MAMDMILTADGDGYDFLTGNYECIMTNTGRFDVGKGTIVHQMDEGGLHDGEDLVTEGSGCNRGFQMMMMMMAIVFIRIKSLIFIKSV
jgi:hypothetical protein